MEQTPLTTVHTAYSNLLCSLMFDEAAAVDTSGYRSETENYIKGLKQTANELFGTLDDENLLSLNFHLLDHDVENVTRF